MKYEFHNANDGTMLTSEDGILFYSSTAILSRVGNTLVDNQNNKKYRIVDNKFIYLKEDNGQVVDGQPYVWYR